MADRIYKPGLRGSARRFGRLGENRAAWLKAAAVEMFLMQYIDGESENNPNPNAEVGDTFVLVVGQPGRRPVNLNFSNMTVEELKAAREFVNLAIDLAEPVAAARDKAARKAADEGDDSFGRIYRPVPDMVKRPWAFGPDGKSLRNGLEDLPLGHPGDADRHGERVRGVRDDVATDESSGPEAEDDPSSED